MWVSQGQLGKVHTAERECRIWAERSEENVPGTSVVYVMFWRFEYQNAAHSVFVFSGLGLIDWATGRNEGV